MGSKTNEIRTGCSVRSSHCVDMNNAECLCRSLSENCERALVGDMAWDCKALSLGSEVIQSDQQELSKSIHNANGAHLQQDWHA